MRALLKEVFTMDRLITVRELSQVLSWDPMTIYKKASSGEIPGRIRIGRRSIRFKESVIEEWLNESKEALEAGATNE